MRGSKRLRQQSIFCESWMWASIGVPNPELETGLSENILHFAEQRAQYGLVVHGREDIQFLQQFFLTLVQLGWNLHTNFDVEIALAVSIENRHALVANAEGCAGLCPLGNLEAVLAFHRRNADFCAHRRLRHRDRHHTMQIIAFAYEERMLLHVQHNIQIASRASE